MLCIECKWAENGIGACGCGTEQRLTADCSDRVLARSAYWDVAEDVFHLPPRERGKPCPLSFTYQAVRNIAAALALAGPDRKAVFGLIYDVDNPYFAGHGQWPGWPAALHASLDDSDAPVRFASVSWQELFPALPLDDAARAWASEKHGLHQSVS